ncbi:MAG: acyl-CoA dehydrogenase family protein [Amphiplicatus sp.]
MDFDWNEDQEALRDALFRMTARHAAQPTSGGTAAPVHFAYNWDLDAELTKGEFFSVARAPEFGRIGAALVVQETARSARVVETVASALIAPLLFDEGLPRPIAVARVEDLTRMVRFLPVAKTLLVDTGAEIVAIDIAADKIEEIESPFAYPVGRYRQARELSARRLATSDRTAFLSLWRLGIALEVSALARTALDFTVAYVKERQIFGRTLETFQAVQHRLAEDAELIQGVQWLALQAAWSGDAKDCAVAALHAQNIVRKVTYDLHQFNGASGFTLENPLHFWTYRLKWLQGDLGGPQEQAEAVAMAAWGALGDGSRLPWGSVGVAPTDTTHALQGEVG